MQAFRPQKILIEDSVAELPLSQRVQKYFPKIPTETIADYRKLKEPAPISAAKRLLILAQSRGELLKPFPKIKHAINLGDYVFNPVSNCHLECTYCILQSYLENNPTITFFPNLAPFFSAIKKTTQQDLKKFFRMGTGELSDSLALDAVTSLSCELIPFFAKLPNAFLELKTKSNQIQNLLKIKHQGHTVVAWSLSPQEIAQKEELKCASLESRLASAQQVQGAGYPIALHLDPMIFFSGWERAYETLISAIASKLNPKRIAWVSLGTLRFDKKLKEIASQRFPQTKIFSEDLVVGPDGKSRYFKSLRLAMYQKVWQLLKDWSQDFPRYLCMEAPWVWKKVTGDAPHAELVEDELVKHLKKLALESS